jgi:uncharacterized membrane protein YdjX (TVP38/TMEM64 family)
MADLATAPPAAEGKAKTSLGRIAALVAIVAVLFLAARQLGGYIPAFAAWVDGLGFWGPVVFILGYAIAVAAAPLGAALTLTAGAIFGIVAGVVYVFIAALLGASLGFFISRYLARSAIEQRLAGNARFNAIDRAVGKEGLKIVFLLRLSPLLSFTLLNYALGLTRVRYRDFLLASFGMLPGTLLYVYYGKLAGDVAALAGGAGVQKGWGYYAVLGLGLVATIAVTAVVTRIARRTLGEVAQ